VLNAPRTGETSGDIRAAASGPLAITGAKSIALNAFWTYSPTDAAGTIEQDNGGATPVGAGGKIGLNQVDAVNRQFIAAAYGGNVAGGLLGAGLRDDLAGLTAYGAAFHLRPGVEITSSAASGGNLTVKSDLDLSNLRYGPEASPGVRGSGEPGYLVLRAARDLTINANISDGFEAPVATSLAALFSNPSGSTGSFSLTSPYTAPATGAILTSGSRFPNTGSLNFDLPIRQGAIVSLASVSLPVASITTTARTLKANVVLPAAITLPNGTVIPAGTNTSSLASLSVPIGSTIGRGMTNVFTAATITVQAMVWPAGSPSRPSIPTLPPPMSCCRLARYCRRACSLA
jgi:hypothetical protein